MHYNKKYLSLFLLLLVFPLFTHAQNSCNFIEGEDISFQVNGQNTSANFTQHFVLTNSSGVIQYSTATLPFSIVAQGYYQAYAINYDHTQTAPTTTLGTNIAAIGGDCVEISSPLDIGVCDCNNITGTLSFNGSGQNANSDFTQKYVLTDEKGLIVSIHSSSPINGLTTGIYNVFAVNYDHTLTVPTLNAGTSIFSIGGDCVQVSAPLGFVVCRHDWGDLADSGNGTSAGNYQTLSSDNGPRHLIVSGLYLGSSVDSEWDGQASNNADGDGGDEDALSITANLDIHPNTNLQFPLSVVNTTGTTAHLEAWIDWNNNGSFDTLTEKVVDLSDDGNGDFGTNFLQISIAATAVRNQPLGMRIRLSHTDDMLPTGSLNNGEVEDYLVTVLCLDGCPKSARVSISRN